VSGSASNRTLPTNQLRGRQREIYSALTLIALLSFLFGFTKNSVHSYSLKARAASQCVSIRPWGDSESLV
jgi:hypothetical protein